MNTNELRALAHATMASIAAGRYVAHSGREVSIAGSIAAAVAGTRLYLPGEDANVPGKASAAVPVIEVTNESSLSASRRLGDDVACLVFASAKNPGGGFLNGAQAQEESIARVSALYACQASVPQFYAFAAAHGHRALVLGAWGCGVFRNDPATVAQVFAGHLDRTAGWFDHVVFAVLDHQRGTPTYNAFARAFGPC